ncbi:MULTISPECIES: exosortase family protein XrtF [unclassified Flavobacterium]|uniref:exosortase family protein XrtF n=1 Tax=unclassified Flavobacterium TaxID=196869 RepID=UPI00360B95CE
MTNYFQQYKPFLLFLGKFFLSYLLLTVVYWLYLASVDEVKMDGVTKLVARQTEWVLKGIDAEASVVEDKPHNYAQIIYQGKYVARIVEGCNAISVIILFVAFIIAFSGRLKPTVLFLLGGSLLVYFLNIFRIVLLTVLVYHFPEQEHFLHGVIFPLIIYGVVFLLWLFWVNNYSAYASGKSK